MFDSRGYDSSLRRFVPFTFPFIPFSLELFPSRFATSSRSVHHLFDFLLVLRLNIIAVISPSEKVLPASLNFEIIKTLQTVIAPNVFTPRGVYDGRKNMFSTSKFSFGATGEVSSIGSLPFFRVLTNIVAPVLGLSRHSDCSATPVHGRQGPDRLQGRLCLVARSFVRRSFFCRSGSPMSPRSTQSRCLQTFTQVVCLLLIIFLGRYRASFVVNKPTTTMFSLLSRCVTSYIFASFILISPSGLERRGAHGGTLYTLHLHKHVPFSLLMTR